MLLNNFRKYWLRLEIRKKIFLGVFAIGLLLEKLFLSKSSLARSPVVYEYVQPVWTMTRS